MELKSTFRVFFSNSSLKMRKISPSLKRQHYESPMGYSDCDVNPLLSYIWVKADSINQPLFNLYFNDLQHLRQATGTYAKLSVSKNKLLGSVAAERWIYVYPPLWSQRPGHTYFGLC